MINPLELRIGNIIDYELTRHVVQGISKEIVVTTWVAGTEIYTHSLDQSDEWPISESFLDAIIDDPQSSDDGYWKIYKYILNKTNQAAALIYYCKKSAPPYKEGDVVVKVGLDYWSNSFRGVHKLQNIIFELTGKELDISKWV